MLSVKLVVLFCRCDIYCMCLHPGSSWRFSLIPPAPVIRFFFFLTMASFSSLKSDRGCRFTVQLVKIPTEAM